MLEAFGTSEADSRGFILPPDKSVLHRLLVIGALTDATIVIPLGMRVLPQDVEATLRCLAALGVQIERSDAQITLHGAGIHGLRAAGCELDCGNSGTTARLLMGALAGQSIEAELIGDRSLSKRPMRRLANLLDRHFGANICLVHSDGLPLAIYGKELHPGSLSMPVSSAQMKSALLLAALQAKGKSHITEPALSRDHTERMLQAFSVRLTKNGTEIILDSDGAIPISGQIEYNVPNDLSAAYYLIAAATLAGKAIRLENVLLNPTRMRFLEILNDAFAHISIAHLREEWNEPRGDIIVRVPNSQPKVFTITEADIPLIIDELPLLAVMAAHTAGQLEVTKALELRHKESDRIKLIVRNLQRFGVKAQGYEDGFTVAGSQDFKANTAEVDHEGDHRIALAFAVMAARSAGRVTISEPNVVRVSFPGFFAELSKIVGPDRIQFSS